VLGLPDYGLGVGCRADFLTVPAETVGEAIVSRPERSLVVKAGRIVARAGRFAADARREAAE
jgi:cytosine deaminase